jgi:imidazolonepropionase-like amidohydrolase
MKPFPRLLAVTTLLATIALTTLLAQQSPNLKQRVFAITNTTVVPKAGQELTKQTLVIRDGLIEALGADAKPPVDAAVIDGKNLVVYPGFIDAGNTWGIDLGLRRSETGPPEPVDLSSESLATTKADNRKGITPEFEVAAALKPEDDAANAWREQGIIARLAVPDGNILGGLSALVVHSGAAPRNAIIKPVVAVHGGLRILGGQGGYPGTLMGTMAHLRQVMYDAAYHGRLQTAFNSGSLGTRPPFDPALDKILAVQKGELPLILEANTKDEIHRALDFCSEFKIKPILLGCSEGWRAVDRLKNEDITCIVSLSFPDKARMQPRRRGGGIFDAPTGDDPAAKDLPAKVTKDYERKHQEEMKNLSVLAAKGIRFAISGQNVEGTDKFLAKLRKAISEGLPADKALQALTQNAAGILGVEKLFGEVAVGKPAHLVAFSGKFNDDKAKVKYVFADGVKFEFGVESKPKSENPTERIAELQEKIKTTKERMERFKSFGAQIPENRRSQFASRMADAERDLKADESELAQLLKEQANPQEKGEAKKTEEKKPEAKKPDDTKAADKKSEGPGKEEPKPDAPAKVAAKTDSSKDKKPDLPAEVDEDRKPKTHTGGNVLIRGATILTVTKGTMQGDVLVQGGKIKEVNQTIIPPTGTTVIEAQGMYVMPGIIDTHSHFAIAGGVNEGTLSVVPECRIRDVIDSDDVQIYRALGGGVTASRLLHGSADCIGGQDAVIKLKYGAPAKDLLIADAKRGVKFALGENVKRGDGRFPNTRLGVEAVFVRSFTEAVAYKQKWKDYEAAKAAGKPAVEPRRDLRLEALADIVDGNILVHSHCYRADEILMLLRVADRFGFKVKSLQHVLEGYKIASEIAAHGASCSTFSDWWAYKIEAFDAIPWNAALLHEAGAMAIMKSDSNELMRHLYVEAAKAMKYGGLSEDDVLKMVTLNAATQLSLQNRLGSIEPGKDADLAIFNAHPLSGYARCDMTIVDGEVYFERGDFAKAKPPEFKPPQARGYDLKNLNIPRNDKAEYVLKGVSLHPVMGPVIANALVQVANGKISAIQDLDKRGEVSYPAGATVVDAKGLHLYPGMIDTGTILGLTELGSARETQDFSEGGEFQPDLRALIGINPDSELIPVTRANGVLTVVTRPTGAIVSGQGAVVNLYGWTPQEMKLIDPFALHIEFPASQMLVSGSPDGPGPGRTFARKAREEKLRLLKQQFEDARRDAEAIKSGINKQLDPRRAALLPYVKGEKPVVISANRRADIVEALKWADEVKVKLILSGGIDAWKVADEIKKRNIPVLCGPFTVMPQEAHDTYDSQYAAAAKLHQAGIKFCIRSAGSTNTRNLPYEAAMAASYGLPIEEALKAVTLYPAQILGLADKLGSIELGKMANLVITDGDMLEPTTQVRGLFIAGVPLDPTSKQTRLYERYRERLKDVKAGRSQLGTKSE